MEVVIGLLIAPTILFLVWLIRDWKYIVCTHEYGEIHTRYRIDHDGYANNFWQEEWARRKCEKCGHIRKICKKGIVDSWTLDDAIRWERNRS